MTFRYIPRYNLNWLLGPTWSLISKHNITSQFVLHKRNNLTAKIQLFFLIKFVLTLLFCFEGCLHRSADLTLVPSVAIAEDFETAKVVSG
jgi:sulfoquinovosyltransferase